MRKGFLALAGCVLIGSGVGVVGLSISMSDLAVARWNSGPLRVDASSPAAEFRVDADLSSPGVQEAIAQPVGAVFLVRWSISAGDTGPYKGYQGKMAVDPAVIEIIGAEPLGSMCGPGQSCVPAGPIVNNAGDSLGQGTIFGGEGIISPPDATTSFAGDVYEVTLRCVTAGTSPLDLRPPPADPLGHSTTLNPGASHPTTTFDATVTCGAGGPAPTVPAGPTATPGGPTPLPGGPTATPVVVPPGMESVGMVAGCNPVTSTYQAATPISEIAAAVSPADGLEAMWEFESGVWLGYSPEFPEVSDLIDADFLDVVFVCVGAPASFVRPVV